MFKLLCLTPGWFIYCFINAQYRPEKNYTKLQASVGISSAEIEAAIRKNRKGRIRKKSAIAKEITTYKAAKLDEAVDNLVKTVLGGEYLQNVRIFTVVQVEKSSSDGTPSNWQTYYIATGDVWGIKNEKNDIKGFKVGDHIVFTYTRDVANLISKENFKGENNKQYKAKVITLKGSSAIIQLDDGGVIIELPYAQILNLSE